MIGPGKSDLVSSHWLRGDQSHNIAGESVNKLWMGCFDQAVVNDRLTGNFALNFGGPVSIREMPTIERVKYRRKLWSHLEWKLWLGACCGQVSVKAGLNVFLFVF